jgi:lipoyl(octanoyl) transferase
MTTAWRFIDTGPCAAAYNMALDEAIAVSVRNEKSPPTLRLYGWNNPSVSLGSSQKIRDININYCLESLVPVVRRPTGGRALLHGNEITYSFSVKTTSGLFSKGLFDSYKKISSALSLALSKSGIAAATKLLRETGHSLSAGQHTRSPLCFASTSYGELSVNSRKIIGSAQKRWADGLLQQGSIPFHIDRDEMTGIFGPDSDHGIRESSMGLMEIFPGLNALQFKEDIRTSFEESFDAELILSSPSHEEITLAQEFEINKYLSDTWTFKR